MNWTRGLTRVWGAATVAWIIFITAYLYIYRPSPFDHVLYLYSDDNGKLVWTSVVENSDVRAGAGTHYIDRLRGFAIDKRWSPQELDRKLPIMAAFKAKEEERQSREHLIISLVAAAAPPLLVFLIGAIVLWVVRGFRKADRDD